MRSPRIPSLSGRAIVVITIVVVLTIGGGVALATSAKRGKYEPRIHRVVPVEKAKQVEHALTRVRPSMYARSASRTAHRKSGGRVLRALKSTPAPTFDPIPARLIAPDTPVPVSPELIEVENGWLVSDGHTLVAVYAGAAGNDSSKGRFAIVRQDLAAGNQTMNVVDVPGAGAVTISDAPTGSAVETAAQRGQIGFRTSRGRTGVLDLAADTVNTQ